MADFRDTSGVTWHLNITVESIRRVKNCLGIDLGNIHDGTPPLMTRLQLDLVLLFDVIFVLLKPQADAKGITDVQFAEAMGGDAAHHANEAFWRSLVDFFQKFGRKDLVAAIVKQTMLVEHVIARMETEIENLPIDQIPAPPIPSFGAPSTAGPASLESTQDLSPPGNSPG